MKTIKNIFVFAAMLLLPVASAHADWRRPYNNNQKHYNFNNCDSPRPRFYSYSGSGHFNNKPIFYANSQIRNGIRNGELSPRETRELRGELFDIKRKENHYWSDGYLSKWERDSLKNEYQDFRHDLKHELNDGEHR